MASVATRSSCYLADCLFCKIIQGSIPSNKILETEFSYSFLDIGPLSKGHALVIPKYHAEFLHQVPDEYLSDMLPVAKKVALAIGVPHYNLLQNNGKIAHQEVPHVHFHIIPKPNAEEGLTMGWNVTKSSSEELKDELSRIVNSL